MKVITKEGFRLPYLGRDRYIELMRSGVAYDKKTRNFSIKNVDNVDHVKIILSEILNDQVTFAQKCLICQTRFTCTECEYAYICGTKDIPMDCICSQCYSRPDFVEKYFIHLKNLAPSKHKNFQKRGVSVP